MSKKTRRSDTAAAIPRMYCGPNIPGVANKGLIFTEMPPLLAEHVRSCPALRSLITDPADFGRVKQAISRKGSLEHTQYQKALEYLRKGV